MIGKLSSVQPNAAFRFPPDVGSDVHELIDHGPPVKRVLALVPKPSVPASTPGMPGEGVVQALSLLTGRWTLQVLWALRGGPVRLGQLHRLLPKSSKKVLTQTLRLLEHDKLVYRRDLSGKVRHVEYHLSPGLRRDLCNLLDHLQRWGDACNNHHEEAHLWDSEGPFAADDQP